METAVWEYVESNLLDPDNLEVGLRNLQANREEERLKLDEQRDSLQLKLDTIKQQREKLLNLYLNGLFTMEEIRVQKQHLDTQQASVEEGLDETEKLSGREEATEYEIQSLREFATLIRSRLDVAKFADRQRILQLLGVRVAMNMEPDGTKFVTLASHLSPQAAATRLLISPSPVSL